jgi:glycine C-acetyltransferase
VDTIGRDLRGTGASGRRSHVTAPAPDAAGPAASGRNPVDGTGKLPPSARTIDLAVEQERRTTTGIAVGTLPTIEATAHRPFRGQTIDLASPDYLSLARHPAIAEAIERMQRLQGSAAGDVRAIADACAAGMVERRLGHMLAKPHVATFPTEWVAGYGAVRSIVQEGDHVLVDAQVRNCLRHAARASTRHVDTFAHHDADDLAMRLRRIRSVLPKARILVVTASLCPVGSDAPPFATLTAACQRNGARLMVDVSHDLGVLGPAGRGLLFEAGVSGEVDYVVGSFSHAFGSVAGFFAASEPGPSELARHFAGGAAPAPQFLTRAQAAAIAAAMSIVQSADGDARRASVLRNASRLREVLVASGVQVCGRVSPVVLAMAGDEAVARRAHRACLGAGVLLNLVEAPAVAAGAARLRMHVSPAFSRDELQRAGEIVARSIVDARG